jgi:hypothetical protein
MERISTFMKARPGRDRSRKGHRAMQMLPQHSAVPAVIGAILSGLCVGFIVGWTRSSGDEVYLRELIRIIFLSICSYLLATVLVGVSRRWSHKRVPNWVFVAGIGSLFFFLAVNLIPDARYIWKFRDSPVIGYASGAMRDEFVRLIVSTTMDSVIALLILGTVHVTAQKLAKLRQSLRSKQ